MVERYKEGRAWGWDERLRAEDATPRRGKRELEQRIDSCQGIDFQRGWQSPQWHQAHCWSLLDIHSDKIGIYTLTLRLLL